MIKRKLRTFLLVVFAFALAVSLLGTITFIRPQAAVDEGAPFYDNPYGGDPTTVQKEENGDYTIMQSASGGGARLFYGEYVYGSYETPYYVDLTDFKMEFSIDRLEGGKSVNIGLLSYVANGSYPSNGYGQGLGVKLADDGFGNTGMTPTVDTFAWDDAGYTPQSNVGNNYLVYNNAATGRTSYLGKMMTLHIFVEGENLNIYIDWARDEVNASTAYDFRASIPLASLPTGGSNAFDYTKAHLMFTNEGGATGADITVRSISDKNTDAYYASMGGKLNNSIKDTAAYVAAVKGFSVSETTGEQVKDYYAAKYNFENLSTAGMRLCDKNEYNAAAALSTEGFADAAYAARAQVFEGYAADTQITDLEDAFGVYVFYVAFEEQLTEYADAAANIRAALAEEDYGQVDVAEEINDILDTYLIFDASRYFESVARYEQAVADYNQLSAFAKSLISEEFAQLNLWYESAYASYYVTTGSYFTSQYNYDGETGLGISDAAYAHRNDDGTTTLRLPDNPGLRLAYGTDIAEGTWEDYSFGIEDFAMTFSVDSLAQSGRFAVNFVTDRSALPWGNETNPGLSVFFRADFGANNKLNVSLAKTAGGGYPTKEEVPEIQNEFGTIGTLNSAEGRFTEDVTIRFASEEGGYKLTVTMGSTSATATLSKAFMDALFVKEGQPVSYSSLILNITVGEGATSQNSGEDTVLTIKSIADDYFRGVEQLKREIASLSGQADTLSAKDSLSYTEIRSFNTMRSQVESAIAALRVYEKEDCSALFAQIAAEKLSAIDSKAAAFVRAEVEALNVTVDNAAETEAALATVAEYWSALSAAQQALYADYQSKVEALQADVVGCKAAKEVIDDIAALVKKVLLPSTVDALRAERDTVGAAFDALDEKYALLVTNIQEFEAYSDRLDAYDPAGSVKEAIAQLFVDYETLTNGNLAAAKTAVEDVKAAYAELTEGQKSQVDNYARIAEFEQKIADFEQMNIDFAVAASFDKKVTDANEKYATVTSENRDAFAAEIESLKEAYDALTQSQKDMASNYALIAEMEGRLAAYDADAVAAEQAQGVIDQIAAIGTVTYTQECKDKIDAARAAYDKLSAEAKAKVTNLKVLTDAESAYDQLAAEAQKGGCSGTVASAAVVVALLAVAGAALALAKKRVIR